MIVLVFVFVSAARAFELAHVSVRGCMPLFVFRGVTGVASYAWGGVWVVLALVCLVCMCVCIFGQIGKFACN